MEDVVRERISLYLKNQRLSVNALSKELGVNQKTLNNQLGGASALGVNTICAIAKRFPELSMEWLLRGNGDINLMHQKINDGSFYVDMLKRQLDEEKERSKEYWTTIQTLISK